MVNLLSPTLQPALSRCKCDSASMLPVAVLPSPPTVSWGTPVILLTPQVDEANARLCPSEKLKGKRSLTVVGCSHSTCFGAAECGAECGDAGFLDCLPSESHNAGMWKSKAFHD